EENTSGVDKYGKPVPPGTMRMSHKGNDLARAYLWNAARVAMVHNPAVRTLYRRLKARGKRGDVAIGHCMRKLLHLVFAVWKTNRPFDEQHYAWEKSDSEVSLTAATVTDSHMSLPALVGDSEASLHVVVEVAAVQADSNDKAAGHKRDMPAQKVVTTANTSVKSVTAVVNTPTP